MPVTTAAVARMNSCPLQVRHGLVFPFACVLASKNKANIPVIARQLPNDRREELLDFAHRAI